MPVLVNLQNQHMEDAPEDAVQEGTHAYPLLDQQGKPSLASSAAEYQSLIQNGYTPPNPAQVAQGLKFAQFDTVPQALAAGAEGAAKTATFGLSTAAERMLGVPNEDILAREEFHPGAEMVGGLAGLAIPGTAGSLLAKAGNAVAGIAERVGGEGLAAKAAGLIAKNATQTMALQGSQELSQMFAGDPNQTAESAIAHVGMAGVLGGVGGAMMGTVPALWKGAGKVMTILTDLHNKAQSVTPEAASAVADMGMKALGNTAMGVATGAAHAAGLGWMMSLGGGMLMKQFIEGALPKAIDGLSNVIGKVSPEALMNGISQTAKSGIPVDAMGFHAMATYFNHAQDAQLLMDKGVQNFFDPASTPIPALQGNPKDDLKLQKALDAHTADQGLALQLGGQIGTYLPDHHAAVARIAASAMNYLQQVKPPTTAAGVLDAMPMPSQADTTQYARTLGLVNNPLSILETMRRGDLTENDMGVMEGVYPGLYKGLQQKLTAQLATEKDKGTVIPYQKRLVLSQFMKQNLDSTIGPMSMMILKPQQQPQPQQGQRRPSGGRQQTAKLGKIKQIPMHESTMTQRAEEDRITPQ